MGLLFQRNRVTRQPAATPTRRSSALAPPGGPCGIASKSWLPGLPGHPPGGLGVMPAQWVPVGGSPRPQARNTAPLMASPPPQPFSKGPTSKSGPTPLLGETKAPNCTGSCSYHTNQQHSWDSNPEPSASGPGSVPAGRGQAPSPLCLSPRSNGWDAALFPDLRAKGAPRCPSHP